MKHLFFIAFFFLLSYNSSTAQVVSEGFIEYDIQIDTENEQAKQMLANSSMKIFFDGKKSRTEFTMGSMVSTTAVADQTTKDAILLMDSMMGKMAVKMEGDQLDELQDNYKGEYKIELVDETKTILAYTCKKAILTMEETGDTMTIWYTEDIQFDSSMNQQMNFDIPGTALAFESKAQGITMNFEAVTVTEGIEEDTAALFSLTIPEGYQVMEFDQFMQMSQQGAAQ